MENKKGKLEIGDVNDTVVDLSNFIDNLMDSDALIPANKAVKLMGLRKALNDYHENQ